ncbi:MAG: hypothetical protein M1828_000569 [Chrysothrix sp. TS-e1954]|nr:MAG: hypothetical protein M1828_000569 [Chrysothrix sp. TS-e1954]
MIRGDGSTPDSTTDILPGSFIDGICIDFSTGTYGAHDIVHAEPGVQEYLLSLDFETFNYLVARMKQFPLMYARSQKTPFSRRDVWSRTIPSSVEDVYALCTAFHRCRTLHERRMTAARLDRSVQEMITRIRPNSFVYQDYQDTVISLQALMTALIVLVFEAGSESHIRAQRFEKPLAVWTRWVWKNAPSHLSCEMQPRQAFIVGESIRRTILMSNTLASTWSVAREGVFRHGVFVDALPFDERTWLFDGITDEHGTWQAEYMHGWDQPQKLLSYREYTSGWERHSHIQPSSIFEEILLVACKGRQRVRSRTLSSQLPD